MYGLLLNGELLEVEFDSMLEASLYGYVLDYDGYLCIVELDGCGDFEYLDSSEGDDWEF